MIHLRVVPMVNRMMKPNNARLMRIIPNAADLSTAPLRWNPK